MGALSRAWRSIFTRDQRCVDHTMDPHNISFFLFGGLCETSTPFLLWWENEFSISPTTQIPFSNFVHVCFYSLFAFLKPARSPLPSKKHTCYKVSPSQHKFVKPDISASSLDILMGLSDPTPTSAPSKKFWFWDFLDGMKPNPTPRQGYGFIVFVFTHLNFQWSMFFLPSPPPCLPPTSYFSLPSFFPSLFPLIV
jgi:hypothetical protein